jgi:hypothetical protein
MTDALAEIQARLREQDRAPRPTRPEPLRCDDLVDRLHDALMRDDSEEGDVGPLMECFADFIERLDASQRLFAHEIVRRTIDV